MEDIRYAHGLAGRDGGLRGGHDRSAGTAVYRQIEVLLLSPPHARALHSPRGFLALLRVARGLGTLFRAPCEVSPQDAGLETGPGTGCGSRTETRSESSSGSSSQTRRRNVSTGTEWEPMG
ncbi:unnamed protein product [Boreogadus saida]